MNVDQPARLTEPSAPRTDSDPARFAPLVFELDVAPDPAEAFDSLRHLPHCLLLDSALADEELGRYSFLAVDPFSFVTAPASDRQSLARLVRRAAPFTAATVDAVPPFQGGVAGLFGYDLNRQLEPIAAPACDEFAVPALAVGFYDVVLAWDHQQDRAWIISQGLPELNPARRTDRAAKRLQQMRGWLDGEKSAAAHPRCGPLLGNLHAGQLAAQHPLHGHGQVTSNFSRDAYLRTIERAIEAIHRGDLFQVNLAQRLLCPATSDSAELYHRLRRENAAPFAAYFDLGPFQILSSSPERFLCVRRGKVETRPIKGTRHRSASPEADLFAATELAASDKDRAENVMIVDLLRNDLSRACEPDSIRVTDLCRVENYRYVKHLVSVVEGRLCAESTPWQLLEDAFPGGSITGAPKVRAMQMIARLEPTARGAYCGAIGYLGFDGTLDTNILIRTVTAGRGWWQAPVGGGIVAQSLPRHEFAETLHKAEGLIRAFG